MTQVSTGAIEYLKTKLLIAMQGNFPKGQTLAASAGIPGIQSGIIAELTDRHMFVKEGPYYTLGYRQICRKGAFSGAAAHILEEIGIPVLTDSLEKEISAVYPGDKNASMKFKAHISSKDFFTAGSFCGLTKWLMVPAENFCESNSITEEELAEWQTLPCLPMDSSFGSNLAALCSSAPVSMRCVQYLVWKAEGNNFDSGKVYEAVANISEASLLCDMQVYSADMLAGFAAELAAFQKELGDSPVDPLTMEDVELAPEQLKEIAQKAVEDGYYPVDAAITAFYDQEDIKDESNLSVIRDYLLSAVSDPRIETNGEQWYVSVDFDPEDVEDITDYISEKVTATAEDIISEFLDIPMEHAKIPELKNQLSELMLTSKSVIFTGNVYSKTVDIPDDVRDMPESLIYTEPSPVEDMEGELFDCMLEPEGFEPSLRSEIYNPLAEDYGDADTSRTIYNISDTKQRCVLKYHHRMAGTFPLCQIQPGFFSIPENIDISPVIISGKTVYINKNTQLIHGMDQFYGEITQVSGTVFYIIKSDEGYSFEMTGETEKTCSIDTNRSLELLELAEDSSLTVFDIICRILSRKPISFTALVTEVNIVRRCSRLLVASILSSYHCFNVKGKSGLWAFDEKKIDQGFNKNKKKYIKK